MENLENLRELTRSQVRLISHLTGWSVSRLASEAGLAASTLNRFMNKDVKHNLSQTTMAVIVITALTRILRRITEEPHTLPPSYWHDVQGILPLADTLLTDTEGEVKRYSETHAEDFEKYAETVRKIKEFISFMQKNVPLRVASREYKPTSQDDLKKRYPNYSDEILEEIIKEAKEGREIPQEEGRRLGNLIATKIIGSTVFNDQEKVHELPHLYLGVRGTDIKNHTYGVGVTYGRRPWFFENDSEAFSIMMLGDSMEPKFTHTAKLYATPNKTPQRRDYVVIESIESGLTVGRFIFSNDDFVEVGILTPAETVKFSKSDVRSISCVIASLEPD